MIRSIPLADIAKELKPPVTLDVLKQSIMYVQVMLRNIDTQDSEPDARIWVFHPVQGDIMK